MLGLSSANISFAKTDGDYVPTAFLRAGGGLSTYKSKMVDSNDTSTLLEYSFGAYAGEDRQFGMLVRRDSSTTNFVLNSSRIAASWQDVITRYRWGPLYLGVVLGSAEIDANNAGDAEFLKARGSGYGENLGLMVPVGRSAMFTMDVLMVANSTAVDLNQKTVTIGQRMDIDLGASFDITKQFVDLLVGYKYRTYPLSVDGTSYAEIFTSTYVGFLFSFYF